MSEYRDLLVCDTETTGLDAATGSLLEVAWIGDRAHGWSFVDFEGEIPPDAKATHHILESYVRPGSKDCAPREAVLERLLDAARDSVVIFHNAAFDLQFLPELKDHPLICTYRCAMHVWPDAPSHKNQTLRYWQGVTPDENLLAGLGPHRALYDAAVTRVVLKKMLETRTVEELLYLTKQPILLETVRFGKYKGSTWKELVRDSGYVGWMRRSGNWDNDVDVMHTLDVLTGRKAA